MSVTVRLIGIDRVMKKLNNHLTDIQTNTDKVFFEFYAKVRQDCMTTTPTVPKDTGNLRNSMFFTYSKGIRDGRGEEQDTSLISRCENECKIAYQLKKPMAIMGFAANYAVEVHEVNKKYREPGSGWKYFITHLENNEDYFVELIKKHMK